jgi:tRNA dimethylallyltransferase
MLFLIGATAVGKTSIIEGLAGSAIEVISADAMQVYRGMDVGTAKPPSDLRDRIPHHLIDIRNPDEQYDVGQFVRDASDCARQIVVRGKLPVVSGGTAYYVRHLLMGLPSAPEADPEIRRRVARRLEKEGGSALYLTLQKVDPATARRIGVEDTYRITRALEVYEQTGHPLSSFPVPTAPRSDLDPCIIGLRRPRMELRFRIERRVDAMLRGGLYDEIARLVSRGYGHSDPGLRAIGYREFFSDDGRLRPRTETASIREELVIDTRRYAKRQETFFRKLPDIRWIDAEGGRFLEGLPESMRRYLSP